MCPNILVILHKSEGDRTDHMAKYPGLTVEVSKGQMVCPNYLGYTVECNQETHYMTQYPGLTVEVSRGKRMCSSYLGYTAEVCNQETHIQITL
jgi:hypothetical protein